MQEQKRSPSECTVEQLDKELIARNSQIPHEMLFHFLDKPGTPLRTVIMKQIEELYQKAENLHPDESLMHSTNEELIDTLIYKARNTSRGIWGKDQRRDFFDIFEEPIERNVNSVAAICFNEDLMEKENGEWELKVKIYGPAFNLCPNEPFYHQPIAAGYFCTGFLISEDTIATAGHCINEKRVKDLRIVFGYRMLDTIIPVIRVPGNQVFKALKILDRVYNPRVTANDWALIKLDRKVEGFPVTQLSNRKIFSGDEVYVMGHPCGLPLKYAPGAHIGDAYDTYFTADLDIYCGSSGSPVFDSRTHEVVGVVVRGDDRDFRWSGRCWISVIYQRSGNGSKGAQCTRVTEFLHYC